MKIGAKILSFLYRNRGSGTTSLIKNISEENNIHILVGSEHEKIELVNFYYDKFT